MSVAAGATAADRCLLPATVAKCWSILSDCGMEVRHKPHRASAEDSTAHAGNEEIVLEAGGSTNIPAVVAWPGENQACCL